MYFYSHRENSKHNIEDLDFNVGVEIDIRDYNSELILSHDPFCDNFIYLYDYLPNLKGRNIIANIKSEGIEEEFVNMKNNLAPSSEYFFLDSSFSMICKYGNKYNFSSRLSEFESLDNTLNLFAKSFVNWVWIDTIFNFPLDQEMVLKLNQINIKKCFTSPDLLGRKYDIENYAYQIKKLGINLDAICCKKENIKLWKDLLPI